MLDILEYSDSLKSDSALNTDFLGRYTPNVPKGVVFIVDTMLGV